MRAPKATTHITTQFREASNMAYDLVCDGQKLVVRIFPQPESPQAEWRVEACPTDEGREPEVVTASGGTRAQALDDVATAWNARSVMGNLPRLDWSAISRVLAAVRAI